MNYKAAYKVLNENGIIDEIISEESKRGENLNIIKKEIIDGINYFLDFIKESSFQGMKYWWNAPENIKQRVTQRTCKELALIRLDQIEKEKEAFEYMIKNL